MSDVDPLAKTLKTNKLKPTYAQIHISVEREFFEAYLVALKRLRYKTQAEFFRHCMRSAILEAERRLNTLSKEFNEKSSKGNFHDQLNAAIKTTLDELKKNYATPIGSTEDRLEL